MANDTPKAALFDVSAVVLISYGAIVLPLPLADATGKLFAMSCILTGITYTITPAYILTPRRRPAKRKATAKKSQADEVETPATVMKYEDDVVEVPVKKTTKKATTKKTKKRVVTKKKAAATTKKTTKKRSTAKKKATKA